MKKYIDIKPDYTVDKSIDNSAPSAPNNSFTTLKNYIPDQGCINTREGINEFSFGGGAPYDPSADPDCLMHLKFEGNPSTFRDCEIQGAGFMQVSASRSISATTSQKKVGSYSLYLDYWMPGGGTGLFYHKKNNVLPAGFPGQGGTGDCIISWWSRFDNITDSTIHIIQHDPVSLVGGFSTQAVDVGGGWWWRWYVTNAAGGNSSLTDTQLQIWTGRWYHVGVWSSNTLGKIGMILWRDDTGTEKYSSMAGTLGGTAANGTNQLWVGMGRSQARTYCDDFILCNAVPATEIEIMTKIRNMRERGL